MSDVILKAENISKQYRLGTVGTGTLSHDLNRWWHQLRGKEDPYTKVGTVNDRSQKATEDYVWAIKDISFEVKRGEVLGIIGKNGAGKSTLLKILSRVTGPTTGSIKTRGRIASLLEVGTGFHPELTGRENVFLNGAILGMTKAEVNEKLEEIISFSGCEMYIDTPVKRYSSGMRVRLAFAVAAHLEPEILVIDEVLAVGDAEFQKKAIGKMQDISQGQGRTVLFVSHNMASVKSLCTRAIVLENGSSVFEGTTDESVSYYLSLGNDKGADYLRYFNKKEFNQLKFQLINFGVRARTKDYGAPLLRTDDLYFEINFINPKQKNLILSLRFKDEQGNFIFVTTSEKDFQLKEEAQLTHMCVPKSFFNQGVFFVDIQVTNGKELLFREEDAISFNIIQEQTALGRWMGRTPGALKPHFKWY